MTHLKKLTLIVAAVLLLAACKKEELPKMAKPGDALRVSAAAQGFSGGGKTKAAESSYTTSFSTGDLIGITVVKNGAVVSGQDNLQYRFDGTDWLPVSAADVLYYGGASVTYLAYYPYSASMSGKTTAAGIVAAFTPKTDQTAYADYTASDLMTGAGTVSGTTLSIAFTHALALLEVTVPQSLITTIKVNGTEVKPYIKAGVYRYITTPATGVTVSGNYTAVGGTEIYDWQNTGVSLVAGQYAKVTVKHAGTGTATDPYNIYTVADMQKIGIASGWTLDKYYNLMADLTLNNWTTIGNNVGNDFTGTFEGNGHTLNLTGTIQPNDVYAGIFGSITKTVKNLKVTGTITVSGNIRYVGAIAGYNYGGTIQNCVSTANITATSSTNDYFYVGGITGYNSNGTSHTNCYTTGNITATASLDVTFVGGIAGAVNNNNSNNNFTHCYASGNISGSSPIVRIGGIVGYNQSGNTPIQNCVALNSTITYTGVNPSAGRICGSAPTNANYANIDMTINGSTVASSGTNGTDITSTQWSNQSWWSGTATFSFGSTDAVPWVFNDGSRTRPIKLYWE